VIYKLAPAAPKGYDGAWGFRAVAAGKDGKRRERTALQRAGSPAMLRLVKAAMASLPAETGLLFFGSDDFARASLEALQVCQFLAEAGPRLRLGVHDSKNEPALCRELEVVFFPALVIRGKNRGALRFLGTPSGYGLRALAEGLSAASSGDSGLGPSVREGLSRLERPVGLKVFISPESEFCLRSAAFALRLAVESPRVCTEVINHLDFPVMSKRYGIGAVPRTVVNDRWEINGARDGRDFVERMLGALVPQPEIYR